MTDRVGPILSGALDLVAAALTNPPARQYVSHGAPAVDDCDGQLNAYLVDVSPKPLQSPQGRCAVVPVVAAAVELWRCYPTMKDDGSAEDAATYDAASMGLAADSWAMWKGLTEAWRAGTFPEADDCANVTFRPVVPLLPQGGYAGLRISFTVQLDGRD